MLKDYQEQLDLPIHKLLQENNTRWWSILLMFTSLQENKEALTLTFADKDKSNIMLSTDNWKHINLLIKLFEPFKIAVEMLGSEKNVSISLIIAVFQILKDLLAAKSSDTKIITKMQEHMLTKIKNRYSNDQIKFLKPCTLLDV